MKNRILKIVFLVALITITALTTGFTRGSSADSSADFSVNFELEQEVYTSRGTVMRYMDVSSPWSGAYLYENFKVTGYAEISESFLMENVPGGSGDEPQSATGSEGYRTALDAKRPGLPGAGNPKTVAINSPVHEDLTLPGSGNETGNEKDYEIPVSQVEESLPGISAYLIPEWSELF